MRSSEIRLRKLKLRLRYKRFANHKVPCTAIWQQPLQLVLALRSCSAMDIIILWKGSCSFLGFTLLLISRVISVALYSEHEKYDKFCSEALISVWGSDMCHKYMTRNVWLYFPSKGRHTQDFYALKKSTVSFICLQLQFHL